MSLDELIKGDEKVMKYLQESTDTVASNKQLIGVALALVGLLIFVIIFHENIILSKVAMTVFSLLVLTGTGYIFYQLLKRF